MFCIVSFIILAIIGIFSATHRELAKEAFFCVTRRLTLRPCQAGYSEKMRGRIIGWLMKRSMVAARLFNRHFELLSWAFFILMVASTFWFVKGVYNFYYYGSCSGLNQSGFCPFDPAGSSNRITQPDSDVCPLGPSDEASLELGGLDLSQFPHTRNEFSDQIVFIGCYSCEYTRQTYPIVKKVAERVGADLVFIHFPVKGDTEYLSKYDYCVNKVAPEKFWTFNDSLFDIAPENMTNADLADSAIERSGIDRSQIKACLDDAGTIEAVNRQIDEIAATGIYGTPTVFVNGTASVGPKPERVYRNLLE